MLRVRRLVVLTVKNILDIASVNMAYLSKRLINYTDQKHFTKLRKYFSNKQIIDIVAIISLFGFLNRWNDTLKTDLESVFVNEG